MSSEMQERIARAIYEGRNGAKCKPWAHQPAAHREPYLSDALAAMKAMREPTEKHRQSSELGAKVRKVAAQLSVERFNGWANPLVADLVDAADFLEGKAPPNGSSEAVLSADAEISRRRGARMTDIDTKALALRVANPNTLCPFCGAYSRRSCELEEEMGSCPWEDSEPDPDLLRDDAHERARMEREYPDAE